MFRPAVIGTVLAAMMVAGTLVSAVKAWMPPPPSQFAVHSYSGRTVGYRGLYETLESLGAPVSRSWQPPPALFRGEQRVLLLQPDLYLLEREKDYLDNLADWLTSGGEIVVVARDLGFVEDNPEFEGEEGKPNRAEEVFGADRFPSALGVDGLRVEPVFSYDEDAPPVFDAPNPATHLVVQPEIEYEPDCEGSLEHLRESIGVLKLPEDELRWFTGMTVDGAEGRITVENTYGERVPIVLAFERGRGRVLLVSEPTLFNNIGLGAADNGVLAGRLALGSGNRPIVFDEYYHGALMGIDAVALLGVFPYGAVGAFVLLATLLWVWSNGVRFGPPLDAPPASRRSILEYVDAMARLFRRGGKRLFVLRVNREGLLDELRRELHLPAGTPSDQVRRRLVQASEERGLRLDEVLNAVDRVLVAGQPVSERELNHFQERLETCRTSKAPIPAPKRAPRPTAS